jgi:FAD dependent oxidoreductase
MSTLQAQIAVIGASLGGVLAAWRAAQAGCTVVLAAQHAWIGGQLTAQAAPPDEHPFIERGGASASYRQFRQDMRELYRTMPGFKDKATLTPGTNPGDGWVSRLCIEPVHAARWLEKLLWPQVQAGRLLLVRGAALESADTSGSSQAPLIKSVTLRLHDNSHVTLHAQLFLDATDTGELLALAQLPYRVGKESSAEFGEPDAPAQANPLDQQPITHVFALRQHSQPGPVCEQPAAYERWRGHHLPHHHHLLFSAGMPGRERGSSATLPFTGSGATLDWWRYRRIVSSAQWPASGLQARADVSLVNWAQNDYALHPLIDGPLAPEQVLAEARELSMCLLHWLQTEAPRSDSGSGGSAGSRGYPEWQPAPDMLGTADGFAQQAYIRESRRIKGRATLTQHDLLTTPNSIAMRHSDAVGVGWYNLDIHPTCISGHGVNASVYPFELPLGAFIPADACNLIPACKNLSTTHLASACTRVHPVEWLVGEVAGLLAAQVVAQGWPDSPAQVAQLQATLTQHGIPLHWPDELLQTLPSKP